MRDVTEFLAEVGLRPPAGRIERVVTYHDPCHLINVQRVSEAPRHLLGLVPGLKVVLLSESDLCCGAAGTYNLSQPEMAEKIGQRKVENILKTGASEVITANVGCAMQIEKELRRAGRGNVKVKHVVEVLAEAYGNDEQ
jgi:glycolate oxidase iron-sulfur subunit